MAKEYLVRAYEKEYLVRAYEEECCEDIYKVIVPDGISKKEVMRAFKNATKYVQHSCCYFGFIYEVSNIDIEELESISKNDFSKYIELGKVAFDEHFEEMLDLEEEHRLEIFQYYIKECMGWKINGVDTVYDFEFEW